MRLVIAVLVIIAALIVVIGNLMEDDHDQDLT